MKHKVVGSAVKTYYADFPPLDELDRLCEAEEKMETPAISEWAKFYGKTDARVGWG